MKKSPYPKLAKQEEEKKMKGLSSWDLQENCSNGELEMSGKEIWDQILAWSPLGRACKREKWREMNSLQSSRFGKLQETKEWVLKREGEGDELT